MPESVRFVGSLGMLNRVLLLSDCESAYLYQDIGPLANVSAEWKSDRADFWRGGML